MPSPTEPRANESSGHPEDVPSVAVLAAKGTKWTTVEAVFVNVVGFGSIVLLSRLLTPSDFGTVALILAIVAVAKTISEFGLSQAVIQTQVRSPDALRAGTTLALLASLICMVVMQALALASLAFLGAGALPLVAIALAVLLPIYALSIVPTALISASMNFRALAQRRIVATAVATAGSVTLAAVGAGVWSLVFQAIATASIELLVLLRLSPWRPAFTKHLGEVRALLDVGVPVMLTQLTLSLKEQGPELLIGSVLGREALGFWSIATRLERTIRQLGSSVVGVVFLPSLMKVRDPQSRKSFYISASRLNAAVCLPIMVGLALTAHLLVPALFGPQWSATVPLAQILAIASAITMLSWLDGPFWVSAGLARIELRLSMIITFLHLSAVLIALPHGLTAVAWALLARAAMTLPLRGWALIKIGGLSYLPFWGMLRASATTVAMGVPVVLIAPRLHLPLAGALIVLTLVGIASYVVASLIFQIDLLKSVKKYRQTSSPVTTNP